MIIYFIYVCQTFIVLFLLTYFCLFNLAHFPWCTLSHTNRLIADLPSSYTSWSQTMIADFPSQDQPYLSGQRSVSDRLFSSAGHLTDLQQGHQLHPAH